ncbi:MaoC family dehydratase N-terminal domain-containing protein [Psychromarinibacter sp. C21-152]|uniref:MaoC family dehydratase N-terminal domain-containing protein n=1 Tax=Psychromarinibacter sediminicola TaxID=3033385 RepID=A0AAE3NVE2_9RHOB|nr:MaoC family dehydratase N-terminal domain-containing protein [Psychromarinibacter sediminicola]MDF0602974.1 MaoC family dehydratase N-terminal domain-containing protein [Psychromarinibacter sediminicola]
MHESIGRTQTVSCALDPARTAALHVALDRPGDPPGPGDPLPPFWHQVYFWDAQRPGRLGPDGHPATGTGLIPDLDLPQRMWAGGRLTFHAAPRLGTPATKTTTVETVAEKTGRSGRLAFVTLRHEIAQDGTLCVTEQQDLVYRQPPQDRTPVAPPQAATDETDARPHRFDTTLLFRYSALTFNGHRIHYDADYARDTEGYAGLVVHGPLLAQLLIHMAEDALGPLAAFTFRGTSALTHTDPATLCRRDTALWVRAADGRQCMEATATPAA